MSLITVLGGAWRARAGSRAYSYTRDWFSRCVPSWTRLLANFAGRPGIEVLEIGSFEGRSAIWLLENILTHPTARITCIDPFRLPWKEMRFNYNMRASGKGAQLTKRKGASQDVLHELRGGAYDIIYIDGSHRAGDVMLDTLLCWRLLKPEGVLIFDDYPLQREKPVSRRPGLAIDVFLELFAGQYELLHKEYQVAVRKLPARFAISPCE